MMTLLAGPLLAAPTNTIDEQTLWAQNVINAYKSIQEQHEATMRAVQQARDETETKAKVRTDALESRLKQLEDTVVKTAADQRDREVATLEKSHRFTLTVVGVFTAVGFVGVLVFAIFLVRAMNRRPVAAPPIQPIAAGSLGGGETGLVPTDPALASNARLRSSLERLEQRLTELEDAPAPAAAGAPAMDLSSRVALLLGKGQSLLNLQQVDTAVHCFDEVIALDPTHAEAFVKKGAALEKLGKLDEAIECYDRAIALDQSMTMAYLCKGGVFNRLERYGEAVQCYEQALRTQQHPIG